MPRWLFWSGSSLLVLVFLGYAYQPVFFGGGGGAEGAQVAAAGGAPTGFLHDDFRALAEVARSEGRSDRSTLGKFLGASTLDDHPLAALSLRVSARLWSDGGSWIGRSPLALRLQNLALLVVAAAGLWLFLRRLLWPWTGSEQANAAGATAALLFVLHPTSFASVIAVGARGELLAALFMAGSGAAFLRGRQERQTSFTALAVLLAVLAGLSSDLAWLLPVCLFVAELCSARRYRPLHARLRTAFTTWIVFSAAVGVDLALRSVQEGRLVPPRALSELAAVGASGGWPHALAVAVEKLGVLAMPVNLSRLGIFGFMGAGLLLLCALQPALVAARSAPRLWGWFLLFWVLAIALSLGIQSSSPDGRLARVHAQDWTHARVLLPGAAAMAVGLALAATALSDLRRALLPLFLAAGFAALAHGNARPFASAARAVEQLRGELADARELHGRSVDLLVLEPPGLVRGVDVLGDALPWLLDPAFAPPGREGGTAPDGNGHATRAPWVRGMTRSGFCALAREPEFAELRRRGLVLLLRPADLERDEPAGSGERLALLVPAPSPTSGSRTWFREGGSPTLDLEALTCRAVRARATAATDTSKAPRLGWKAKGATVAGGVLAREGYWSGVWLKFDDEPTALFDVGSSVVWLLGERVRLLWPVEGWSELVEAEVLDEPPTFDEPVAPRIDPEHPSDWTLPLPHHALVQASGTRGSWRLELLDLASFGYREIALAQEEGGPGSIRLRAPDAAAQVAEWTRLGGGPVAWSVTLRIDGVTVVRAVGR
jgi:hypothetical protein